MLTPVSFRTTRWTLVRAAGGAAPAERRAALETLCSAYWPPVHAFVRRQSASPVQAEDLTQAFFARLLERDDLSLADPERGRFRSFLLGTLRHFLANEDDRERALKRGGGRAPLSLDRSALAGLEHTLDLEPAANQTPEREFERAWAGAVLARARTRLAEEQQQAGKHAQWQALEPHLSSTDERGHGSDLARRLGISENAVRVALHRLRRRFGELVRDEVRETVGPGEVEDEVRQLLRALE
jgi:RNA polymerase sigma-70 factor (ECF subfamily)